MLGAEALAEMARAERELAEEADDNTASELATVGGLRSA
jgi:hypothetical protein